MYFTCILNKNSCPFINCLSWETCRAFAERNALIFLCLIKGFYTILYSFLLWDHICVESPFVGKERKKEIPNGLKERLVRENNIHLDLTLNETQGRFITLIGVNGHGLSLFIVLPQCAPRNCR